VDGDTILARQKALGLIVDTKQEALDKLAKNQLPQNGFVYVIEDKELYSIQNGSLVALYLNLTKGGTITGPVTINNSSGLTINGTVYNGDGIKPSGDFTIDGKLIVPEISTEFIHSKDYIEGVKGYAIYYKNGKWYL